MRIKFSFETTRRDKMNLFLNESNNPSFKTKF